MARRPTYAGPKAQIQPAELDKYERSGTYVVEEKHDGHWAEVTIGPDGRIAQITSRSSTVYSGSNVEGLVGFQTNLPNTVLIAELESGTEAANKRNQHLAHRRLHVFDVVKLLNNAVTHLVYEQRRTLLEKMFVPGNDRIVIVRNAFNNFRAFFDEVVKAGGEGIVLKRLGRKYRAGAGSDGKTDDWIRCKRFRFVDYYVMSIGRSDGGSPNFQVGLVIDGKMTRVATIKNIPDGLNYQALVGCVIECKGAEVHDSGALRHGHYERTRHDKDADECTLEAALNA